MPENDCERLFQNILRWTRYRHDKVERFGDEIDFDEFVEIVKWAKEEKERDRSWRVLRGAGLTFFRWLGYGLTALVLLASAFEGAGRLFSRLWLWLTS